MTEGDCVTRDGLRLLAPVAPSKIVAVGLNYRGTSRDGSTASVVKDRTRRQLIFPLDDIVAFVSSVMTLLPGDVIATGTPAGIGPLQAGDRVTVRISGIGSLENPVVAGE